MQRKTHGPPSPHVARSIDAEVQRVMEMNEMNRKRMDQVGPQGPQLPQIPGMPQIPGPPLPPGFPPMPGRSYSPGLARFLTQVRLQELMGGEHPYAYAYNNPITYTDPSGLSPCAGGENCNQHTHASGWSPYVAHRGTHRCGPWQPAEPKSSGTYELCIIMCKSLVCSGLPPGLKQACELACKTHCKSYNQGNYSHFYKFCWTKSGTACDKCCARVCEPLEAGSEGICLKHCLAKCSPDEEDGSQRV